MSRLQNCCVPGLLLATLIAAGCAESPTAPTTTDAAIAAGTTAAKPGSSLPVGFYQMTFLNSSGQEVTTLPVGAGSHLLVRVHVEDSNHLLATDGSALFEVCRWKGVSPTTGPGAAPRQAPGAPMARHAGSERSTSGSIRRLARRSLASTSSTSHASWAGV